MEALTTASHGWGEFSIELVAPAGGGGLGSGAQTGVDAYLGASLLSPDSFETGVVSRAANHVACGVTLADPECPGRARPNGGAVLRDRHSRPGW